MNEQNSAEIQGSNNTCPSCGGDEITVPFDEVEGVCDECGLVIYDWSDPTLSDVPVGNAQPKSANNEATWSEVRPAHNSTQYRFSNAIEIIEEASTELSVPHQIRIKAAELYVDAALGEVVAGRSVVEIAAGVLYISCKAEGKPRPLKRIATAADIDQGKMNKSVRCLQRELPENKTHSTTVTTPEAYLEFLCSDLNLKVDHTNQSASLIQEVSNRRNLGGKHPAGVAAAAVYLTADEPPTQRELATAAGVATETVRVRLNELRGIKELANV